MASPGAHIQKEQNLKNKSKSESTLCIYLQGGQFSHSVCQQIQPFMHCVFSGGHCCVFAQSQSGQVLAHTRNKIVPWGKYNKGHWKFYLTRGFYCWPAFPPEQQQGQKVVMCTRVQYGRQFTSNLVNWKHLKEYSQIHMLTLWSLMLTSPGSRLWSPASPSNLTNICCSQCYTLHDAA